MKRSEVLTVVFPVRLYPAEAAVGTLTVAEKFAIPGTQKNGCPVSRAAIFLCRADKRSKAWQLLLDFFQ